MYYSIDGGVANQKGFNCQSPGDVQDWDSSVSSDPFNAFGTSGVVSSLSAVDEQVMDVIGWNLTTTRAVPEPSSIALVMVAGGLLWQQRRRKLT